MAIRPVTYYRISLVLPLILPLYGWIGGPATGALPDLSAMLIASMIFAGVPYVAFALIAAIWMAGKDGDRVRRVSYFAPLLFLPIEFAWLLARLLFFGTGDPASAPVLVLWFALPTLLIGYCYVVAVDGFRFIGVRLRWLATKAEPRGPT